MKEAEAAPDKLPVQTDYTLCPAGSDSLRTGANDRFYKEELSAEVYSGTHAVFWPTLQTVLSKKLLVLPDDQSLMYHYTGGRDRTGMATALLLYVLGVRHSQRY